MTKKICYVDLDGVCADFGAGIRRYAPHINIGIGEYRDDVDDICEANTHIFLELPPIKDAVASVLVLSKFYDIYFLSTPMWNVPDSFGDKRIWLDLHFGAFAHKRLILSHRKDLNVGHYLIDDTTRNGAGEFTGEHIHFGSESFPDWDVVTEYLLLKHQIDLNYEYHRD